MGDVFIWGYFYQKFVHPLIWGEPGDQARIEKTLAEDVPAVLDYLEAELPAEGFLFGEIGVADIAIASVLHTASYAGFGIDAARWPRTAAFVARALAHDSLAHLLPFEQVQVGTTPAGRRQALLAAGAPLTAETLGTREAKRGIMTL
jgi:glutathione S-transferase